MNPHFQKVVIDAVLQENKGSALGSQQLSRFRIAKNQYRRRKLLVQHLKDGILILLGVFAAGFGLKSFLLPNKFIDGGATGISLLITELTTVPLWAVILLVNIPFIILGYQQIGKLFTAKTIFAIGALALVLALVQYPQVTSDKLLVAVFGGFFLGAGIGFAVRGGGVLDGTEVLAIYISRKTSMTIGDVIILINIIIFSTAVALLGIDAALYSMLTYLAASKTVDFLIEGIEEYTGVTIISYKYDAIGKMITEKLGRGITVYQGRGGYGKSGYRETDTHILFTVITRLEISRLKSEIEIIDPEAFVVMNSIKDTRGGMIKKRPLK